MALDLAKLKRLCDEATPGGWEARVKEFSNTARARFIWSPYGFIGVFDDESAESNAEFIAAARNALPELLSIIDTLQEDQYLRIEHNAQLILTNSALQDRISQLEKIIAATIRSMTFMPPTYHSVLPKLRAALSGEKEE